VNGSDEKATKKQFNEKQTNMKKMIFSILLIKGLFFACDTGLEETYPLPVNTYYYPHLNFIAIYSNCAYF
jgi:hypothetical protein